MSLYNCCPVEIFGMRFRGILFSRMEAINPSCGLIVLHDDVIKWKHFPRYWPFVRGIHRSPVNSPNKGQ